MLYINLRSVVSVEVLTAAEGEAVDERHAVKPVVVLGVAHREKTGSIPQQSALQPGREAACRSEVTHRFFIYIYKL